MRHIKTVLRQRDTVKIYYFFFNDTATTEIYTLSLHDALPISRTICVMDRPVAIIAARWTPPTGDKDRKSTRLNSSHLVISYAVFCLKKKHPHPPPLVREKGKTMDRGSRPRHS